MHRNSYEYYWGLLPIWQHLELPHDLGKIAFSKRQVEESIQVNLFGDEIPVQIFSAMETGFSDS